MIINIVEAFMTDKNITQPIVIRESQRSALEIIANREERSLSYIMRKAIDDYIEKNDNVVSSVAEKGSVGATGVKE